MRVLSVLVLVMLLSVSSAFAHPPVGSTPTDASDSPCVAEVSSTTVTETVTAGGVTDLGLNLDKLMPHPAPVSVIELQLIKDGWRYASYRDSCCGNRNVYQIKSQAEDQFDGLYGSGGMFVNTQLVKRVVKFERPIVPEGNANYDRGKLKESWSVNIKGEGEEELTLTYFYAKVPVLVEVHELESTVTETTTVTTTRKVRVGVVDP